jgi:hypothetical protein
MSALPPKTDNPPGHRDVNLRVVSRHRACRIANINTDDAAITAFRAADSRSNLGVAATTTASKVSNIAQKRL